MLKFMNLPAQISSEDEVDDDTEIAMAHYHGTILNQHTTMAQVCTSTPSKQ